MLVPRARGPGTASTHIGVELGNCSQQPGGRLTTLPTTEHSWWTGSQTWGVHSPGAQCCLRKDFWPVRGLPARAVVELWMPWFLKLLEQDESQFYGGPTHDKKGLTGFFTLVNRNYWVSLKQRKTLIESFKHSEKHKEENKNYPLLPLTCGKFCQNAMDFLATFFSLYVSVIFISCWITVFHLEIRNMSIAENSWTPLWGVISTRRVRWGERRAQGENCPRADRLPGLATRSGKGLVKGPLLGWWPLR